jgi:hypothetical protein
VNIECNTLVCIGMNHEKNINKLRILTFMSLGEKRHNKQFNKSTDLIVFLHVTKIFSFNTC